MTLNKIYTHIRKVSLRRLVWPLFPIIVSAIILHIIPYDSMINPVHVSSTQDAIKAVEEGHKYLEVTLSRLIYSGYNHMVDSEVYGEYYYDLASNTECLFYMLDPSDGDDYQMILYDVTLKVKVTETTGIFDNMLEMFSGAIDWTAEGVSGVTKPYVLSQPEYNYTMYIITYSCVLLMLAYGIIMFMYNLIFVIAPWMSPRLLYAKWQYERKIFKINNFLEKVAAEMDEPELLEGDMYITKHFFVNMSKTEFCIIPIKRLRMVYESSTLKSFLGMHLKVTYSLHMKCTQIVRYHVTKKTLEQANSVLDYFREKTPNTLVGYTDENRELVKEIIKKSTGWFKKWR